MGIALDKRVHCICFCGIYVDTAQAPQQIPGKQLQGKGKLALVGTGLFSPKLDSLSSIQPAYGIVVLYGPCMALFSIKGVIRSKEGNAMPNCKVIVSDTATKQGIDSTVSHQDGSFSFINEPTYSLYILGFYGPKTLTDRQTGRLMQRTRWFPLPIQACRDSRHWTSTCI